RPALCRVGPGRVVLFRLTLHRVRHLPGEGPVDVDERRLLAIGQGRVGVDGRLHVPGPVLTHSALVEEAGLAVQRLGRDLQALGEFLQDLCAGLLQSALDLAQVGVADSREIRELPQREPGVRTLLAQVLAKTLTEVLDRVPGGHTSIMLALVSRMQTEASVRWVTPEVAAPP